MSGHIVIFIEGYRPKRRDTAHFFIDLKAGTVTGGPDSVTPPHMFEPGSEDWLEEGWAIGDNARGVPCLRNCGADLKQFFSFEDAAKFVENRQRKHPEQRHVLVYSTDDDQGFPVRVIVTSQADIDEIEADIAKLKVLRKAKMERRGKLAHD